MAAEEWRIVPGFDHYEVSDLGRVRRRVAYHWYAAGRLLKPSPSGKNLTYLNVDLRQGGRQMQIGVHRLVALAFLGSPPTPKHHASHIDGKSHRNVRNNIEWATPAENERRKREHGTARRGHLCGEEHGRAVLNWKVVKWLRKNDAPGLAVVMAPKLNVSSSTIRMAIRGVTWKSNTKGSRT